ncbi:TetR/AcrR family transcriptional regulator [Streptomyces sp. VRA16 Mangrove soil]|uniref:TetR/AcrR family transcriptional regulator n=1 Tax=Streptomyces sp. VRA16 Mangrove soil TaxID=2817434 RepID=UPI001A9FD47A|nr:TetR/AcrR family transcriptional regulator [Streptomyces sp. VRA16 Mangrove soil]MBO1332429.1 TetR/AcrR family transcriptional regulator [Streptomyces sp. VRA16 Mangrove soil]
MPKISAATVPEHRAQQRAALIRAAVDILAEHGAAAVTPAAVAARAGLARPSFYQYFPSSAALLAAIVEDTFTTADAAMAEALDTASEPHARIDAFVHAELHLAAQGLHRPAAALMRADLPAECRDRVHELHHLHYTPLINAIDDLNPADPRLTAQLIGGLLQAAMAAVDNGTDPNHVATRTLALIQQGLGKEPSPGSSAA